MKLFDMKLSDRREYVARLLGLNPNVPESLPIDMIDRLLDDAEEYANNKLKWNVFRMVSR